VPAGGDANATAGGGGQAETFAANPSPAGQRPPIDPRFVGVWVWEAYGRDGGLNASSHRVITIWPNGQFTDRGTAGFSYDAGTGLADGSQQGWVELRGNTLTFTYDNGTRWTPAYQVFSNGMKLDGYTYVKE
jgi:hypothetical protein